MAAKKPYFKRSGPSKNLNLDLITEAMLEIYNIKAVTDL